MRWNILSKPNENKVQALQNALQVNEIIATLLVQRGVETFEQAKSFFRPSLQDLHDPYLMKDMDKAVMRLQAAIQNQENILVFGDYDVDGTTSVALMSSYLKSIYPNVDTYIPDRYKEGYGISYAGIDYAQDNNISLIIALDCGIKSIEHIAYAKMRGIDFIICDHHNPGEIVPDAQAVLDPKQKDCNYPYKELCGCGVGFKLIQAFASKNNQSIQDLVPYLDLVATAIAADIVPITGENRVLTTFGLEVINTKPRPGMWAFLKNLKKKTFTVTDLVFTIAPRINAAGRIHHGNAAVALLTEFDENDAEKFAAEIEIHNTDRKELDKSITQEALQMIKTLKEENNFTTVLCNENWHKGVIGIVASRLTETYYRPTIVFTKSGDKYAASARSVKGFDLYDALENCAEHLEQFGGHMYAAGMTILPEKFINFKNAFEKYVSKTIKPEMLIPEILADTTINLDEITPKILRVLKQFEPFGPGNMTPIFLAKNLKDTGYAKNIGKENEHIKLNIKQTNNSEEKIFGAIGFHLAKKWHDIPNKSNFEALFSIEENHWNNQVQVQLQLRDIQ
jgi:single-stranded-DNA-specific exonuclease